jgi:hypothetical protein
MLSASARRCFCCLPARSAECALSARASVPAVNQSICNSALRQLASTDRKGTVGRSPALGKSQIVTGETELKCQLLLLHTSITASRGDTRLADNLSGPTTTNRTKCPDQWRNRFPERQQIGTEKGAIALEELKISIRAVLTANARMWAGVTPTQGRTRDK